MLKKSLLFPPLKENYTALGDAAASLHYIEQVAVPHWTNIKSTSGPTVTVATRETMKLLAYTQLPLAPELYTNAQHSYIFDDLQTGSLISLVQLCNYDCVAIFSRYTLKILIGNKVIITGRRNDTGV